MIWSTWTQMVHQRNHKAEITWGGSETKGRHLQLWSFSNTEIENYSVCEVS